MSVLGIDFGSSGPMRTAIVLGTFGLIVFVFFSDVLVGGDLLLDGNPFRYYPWRSYATAEDLSHRTYRQDSILTYLPRQVELSRGLHSGRFPLWNPYVFAGTPFFADPQSRVLYPVSVLLALADPRKAVGYDLALHFFLAMLGMYIFLRATGATRLGAMVGGFSYGFSSFFFTRLGHPTFVASASWIPYLFYAYEVAQRRECRGTLLLTVFLSMGYLAGFPQVAFFGVGALIIYAICTGIDSALTGGERSGLRGARVISISAVLSLLLVAVHLLPFWEYVRNSVGLGIRFEEMKRAYLGSPILLLRSLFPNFFGNPLEGTDWSGLTIGVTHPYNPSFMVYCGLGSLLAALGGLVFLPKARHMRAFVLLLVVSIGFATSALLLKASYSFLPILRYSKVDRVAVISCFAISGLSGWSLSMISRNGGYRLRKYFRYVVVGLTVAVLIGSIVFAATGDSVITKLVDRAKALEERSRKITEWVNGDSSEWLAYEKKQITIGLVFVLISALLLVLYASPGLVRGTARACVVVIFLGCLVFDVGLAARTYYTSQPSHILRETEGIKVLERRLGSGSRWRMRVVEGESPGDLVLPPNINQIFGIHSLDGRSTMFPEYYGDLDRLSRRQDRPAILAREDVAVADATADLMCARYVLSPGIHRGYLSSPVLKAVAGSQRGRSRLGLISLGGQKKLAMHQDAGGTISARVLLPYQNPRRRAVTRLDCWIGFSARAQADMDSLTFVLACKSESGRAEIRKTLHFGTDRDRWHPLELDISSVSRSQGVVTMSVIPSEPDPERTVTAAWGGLELVFADCFTEEITGGYRLDVGGRFEGALHLLVTSDAQEVPLEISGADSGRIVQTLAFPSGMPVRCLMVDLRKRNWSTLAIRSDSVFSIAASKVVYAASGPSDHDLIYDGDMHIYENPGAVARGICVDRNAASLEKSDGKRVLALRHPERVEEFGCGRCEIICYEPERILMNISADRDCYLLFQDLYYPGWRAFVDGDEQEILRSDMGIRSMELAGGNHRVEMKYQPKSLRYGLLLTCVGFALSIVYGKKAKAR
jgi:hypothetical protein